MLGSTLSARMGRASSSSPTPSTSTSKARLYRHTFTEQKSTVKFTLRYGRMAPRAGSTLNSGSSVVSCGMRSTNRMGISDVLCSERLDEALKPIETTPKSISPTEKWNEGPTTRPLKVSGRGAGCPCSMHRKVSCTSPRAALLKPTSQVTCSRGCSTPASGEKLKQEPMGESFGASEKVASTSPWFSSTTSYRCCELTYTSPMSSTS
mmetsp:Transcript_28893/g.78861  ORF Transcript_28893/g.78861 Transcript_28893/m.78861 type:complete len:207 (-) Transcript_28893:1367-1987(-)